MWCAIASDGVTLKSSDKVRPSKLEYAHGISKQHWLASMRNILNGPAATTMPDDVRHRIEVLLAPDDGPRRPSA